MRLPSIAQKVGAATALFPHLVAAVDNVLDLSNQKWQLSSPQLGISVPGTVPSHAHVDLYAANVIDDPLYGLNDFNLRWITYSNWTYTSNIKGLQRSSHQTTHLVFNGLDTYAGISFCGQHIANTDNQFRQYVFDVSDALSSCRSTEPELIVNLGATPNISAVIAAEPGQETWPDGVDEVYEYPNRQFVRKEQSDFGWDWGPAFVPAGIWQPAYIVQLGSHASLFVKNSDFDLYRRGQLNNLPPDQTADWIFNASIDVVGSVPSGSSMRYTIIDSDSRLVVSKGNFGGVENGGDVVTGVTTLDASKYELWWPNGLGPQKLYNMTVDVVSDGKTIASVNKRMGFRTIVLNTEPISEAQLALGIINGSNYHFEINGHEFFAKGSNFVPPDPFWPRVTAQHIESIFTAVVEANQNMLRVWSSGAYSPDFLYDLADEMGLLLWCEFEFSVSLYPAAPEFLENVRQEAVYQVRRANHHPSLALWAGGNEMEKDELPAVRSSDPSEYPRYLDEYFALFLDTLLPAVYGNSHSISYVPCSTNNGYIELNFSLPIPFVDRLYNTTPGYLYGDSDHYNYDASQAFDVNSYLVGRFANEFGFHSMPSLETWREAVPEDELYFNSTTTLLRNHHYPAGSLSTDNLENPLRGMGELTRGVELWYPSPSKTDAIANFSAWCHTSQVFQADFYKTKIQYYRASSGLPQRQLGALYWQLNDIWQAPTWSGIEYDGRWKVMFYATKDIFQPVIIAPVYNVTDGVLTVYAVSDQWRAVTGEASMQWLTYDGTPITSTTTTTTMMLSTTRPFVVGAVNATVVARMNITELTSNGTLAADNAVLLVNLTATGTAPNGDGATRTYTHSNFFTATPLSQARLVDPGLRIGFSQARSQTQAQSAPGMGSGTFTVTAETGVSAFTWVALDPRDSGIIVVFEDNGFVLRRGESRRLGYRVVRGASEGWERRVGVSSIWDNTQPS